MTPNELSALKAELRSELLAELRLEQGRKERGRTMFRRLMDERVEELSRFDWQNNPARCGWKARDAIGTLLRTVYKVDAVADLPSEREAEIERFIDEVIRLMQKHRRCLEAGHERAG